MPALQLRLPQVMVRIDETGRQDLPRAVNHLGRGRRWIDPGGNPSDSVALDEQGMCTERDDTVSGIS